MRQKGSPEQLTPPETVATNRVLAKSSKKKTLGTCVDQQVDFTIHDTDISFSKSKRKRRKMKRKKQQPAATLLSGSKIAISLSSCPSDVLDAIIAFVRGPEKATRHRDLFSLRLCVRNMEPKRPRASTFDHRPNQLRLQDMIDVYDKMCVSLLLSRLTNLRVLEIHCYVGGGYASLLTQWARKIWEFMPLNSLEVLTWLSRDPHYDQMRMQWPAHDACNAKSVTTPGKPPTDDCNVISFLRFVPGLKQLTFSNDLYLAGATPSHLPDMQFLTSIWIDKGHPKETVQWMMNLLQCSPMLKSLRTSHSGTCEVSTFRQALRLVRNTIEDIDIGGEFKGVSSSNGGIGTFRDFPKLTKISTDLASFAPLRPPGWSQDFCLLELLPPNLESFHLRLTGMDGVPFRSEPLYPNGPWKSLHFSGLVGRLYELLEDVALAKESGRLTKLRSITIDNPHWELLIKRISQDGPKRLVALCAKSGIEWKCSGGIVKESSKTRKHSPMDTDTDTDTDTDSDTDTDTETYTCHGGHLDW
ncbi:hypothetical protein BZA77DRAFT_291881 [Pyronema omphalodes]|nr:hypothetical protein BZA77DRAFT_375418 [Pyronema omphalodes]KAI5817952.1 hypothetical protein BZA77DRAFT_291881 [Pyronema omphalodes]